MMAGLRELVYGNIIAAPEWVALFPNAAAADAGLYPDQAPDSPSQRYWGVLRWGASDARLGRDTTARIQRVTFWAYSRESSYSWIIDALSAVGTILGRMPGTKDGAAGVIGVESDGQSEDFWDDIYPAAVRFETWRIAASGR